jgi:hypothetical protein
MEARSVSNAAAATAAPKVVKLGKEEYTLAPLRMGDLGLIQEEINKLPRPDLIKPLRADLEGMPSETVQAILLPAAMRMVNWPPDLVLNPDAIVEVSRRPAIMRFLMYLAIKRNHPNITQPKADEVYNDLTQDEWQQFLKVALDLKEVPEEKKEDKEAGAENGTTTRPATAT